MKKSIDPKSLEFIIAIITFVITITLTAVIMIAIGFSPFKGEILPLTVFLLIEIISELIILLKMPNWLKKILEKNQETIVRNGYKIWYNLLTSLGRLSTETQITMIDLAKTNPEQLAMLLEYPHSLNEAAYKHLFEDESLKDVRKEYMAESPNTYWATEVFATQAITDQECEGELYEFVKNGKELSIKAIRVILENEKLYYVIEPYVKNYDINDYELQVLFIEKAASNDGLKKALCSLIDYKKKCKKKLCRAAEVALIKQGLSDVFGKYYEIVDEISEEAQEAITYKVCIEKDKQFQEFLEKIIQVLYGKAAELFVDAALLDDNLCYLLEKHIEVCTLKEEKQILIVKKRKENQKYNKCLEVYIEKHGLCEKADQLQRYYDAQKTV